MKSFLAIIIILVVSPIAIGIFLFKIANEMSEWLAEQYAKNN